MIIIDQTANPEMAPISSNLSIASLTASYAVHISLRCWKCPEGLLKVIELVRKFRGWKVVVGHGSLTQAAQGEPLTQNAAVMHGIPSHKLRMQKTWVEMRPQPINFQSFKSCKCLMIFTLWLTTSHQQQWLLQQKNNAALLLTHTAKHVGEHEEQRWLTNSVVQCRWNGMLMDLTT